MTEEFMGSNLSTLLKLAMAKASLNRLQAVQKLGYINISKGLRRLDAWLSGCGVPSSKDQVMRIVAAFGLAEADIHTAMVQDAEDERRRRKELRGRDPDFHVTVRAIPGFYLTYRLPGSLSLDEALRQAHGLAGGRSKFTLNTTENKTYWCDDAGHIYSEGGIEPCMSIKGKSFLMDATT
jgi:hypothetical protein